MKLKKKKMKLKDKIFQILNEQPHLHPIGIHLPEFAKLRDADKSEDKSKYAQQLAYVYHMHEYDSPYYDRKNKEQEIGKDYFGKRNFKPTKMLAAALQRYKELDSCAERRALDAATTACDMIAENINKMSTDSSQFEHIISILDEDIKNGTTTAHKIHAFQQKLDIQEQQMKILTSITKTMPQLEKTIETSLNLRKKVTTAVFKGEGSDSMIGEFLFDTLMDELQYEAIHDELESDLNSEK